MDAASTRHRESGGPEAGVPGDERALVRQLGAPRGGDPGVAPGVELAVTVISDRPGAAVRTLRLGPRSLLGARLLATLLLLLLIVWGGAAAARLARATTLDARIAELEGTLERRELELAETRDRLEETTLAASRLLYELGGVGAKVREVQSVAGIDPGRSGGTGGADPAPAAARSQDRSADPAAAPVRTVWGAALLPRSSVDLVAPVAVAEGRDPLGRALSDARADLGELDAALDAVRDTVENRRALAAATPSVWPVRGWISSYFGLRRSPVLGRTLMHEGLDLVAPYRTPVRVSAAGVVATAGWSSEGYGYHVIVDHGHGFATLYAHLSEIQVEVGERLEPDRAVGLLGTTGLSTGPHLHFEIWRDGVPIDPTEILGALPEP